MRQVNIQEAKTHLSRLVEEAAAGAPFVICKAGRPMVCVTPLEAGDSPARPLRGNDPRGMPVVLSEAEVRAERGELEADPALVVGLLFENGLRLMEK